ncbi:MAG: tRNA (adenosine(37)-N6)-threonylcarbamoyltransferase complex ATPase subunit type 1 TsaE [Lentisphaeria bacterium]|nr:tRNA (adenosine(37)-N6)-threonylcarbamoyltransferase complex ATPase subunit type 1 TsaE [Lentisphaeria bacterium]
MTKVITSSEEETEQLAAELALRLPLGSMVALHGNLGCGKTVFARGFARALGIDDYVTSPTFTIVQEYYFGTNSRFYHLDLYRISNSDDAIAFGIDEFLLDKDAYCLLEWPVRIEELWTKDTVHVYFEHVDEEHRSIDIKEQK